MAVLGSNLRSAHLAQERMPICCQRLHAVSLVKWPWCMRMESVDQGMRKNLTIVRELMSREGISQALAWLNTSPSLFKAICHVQQSHLRNLPVQASRSRR